MVKKKKEVYIAFESDKFDEVLNGGPVIIFPPNDDLANMALQSAKYTAFDRYGTPVSDNKLKLKKVTIIWDEE